MAPVDEDRGKLYLDAVLDALGAAAGEILEAMMSAHGYEQLDEGTLVTLCERIGRWPD